MFPRQRHIGRIQLRHHPAADEPQVRPQRPPCHAGQARRAPGEPLGHRRVQQHLRHRVQAQADAEAVPASLPAAHSRFFARSFPSGATWAITSRANAAACGDSDEGRHRAISAGGQVSAVISGRHGQACCHTVDIQ